MKDIYVTDDVKNFSISAESSCMIISSYLSLSDEELMQCKLFIYIMEKFIKIFIGKKYTIPRNNNKQLYMSLIRLLRKLKNDT